MSFIPNPRFGEILSAEQDYRDGLAKLAEPVRAQAEANVRAGSGPWVPRKGRRPVEVQTDDDGVHVVNTDYAAAAMEFGSKQNPVHAPLRRAVRSAGLRLEETPKP